MEEKSKGIRDKDSPRAGRCLFFVLVGIAALCAITSLTFRFLINNLPIYVELNIPEIGVVETVRSTFTWGDTGNNYFIWRQQILVTKKSFTTWDSVVDYYDGYLTAQGWKQDIGESFTPCDAYMPETEFLEFGQDGYVFYRRPEAEIYDSGTTICLAVFKVEGYYNVALQTINPSPLSAWSNDMG